LRTCPRVGLPSTATAHGVFFPTGTVIVAGKGRRLPLSVYWRNSPAPQSGGGFARGYSRTRKGPWREREPIGPNGWAQIPYLGGNNGVRRVSPRKIPFPAGSFRAIGAGITVPDGKFCRSVRETIPFSTGSITVPVGNEYRSLREALPYPWGMNTVPMGNFVGGFSCKKTKNKKALALRLFMLVH
jgi:hypothetical protein